MEHESKIYTILSKERPSLVNKEMAVGLLLGALAAPFAALSIPGFAAMAAISIAGGAIGGSIGKKRMEEEATIGKHVKPPTMKNTSALIGTLAAVAPAHLIGGMASMLGPYLIIEAIEAGSLAFLASSPAMGIAATTIAGLATGGIAFLACIGIGAAIGGLLGKKEMAKEYAAAQMSGDEVRPEVSKSVGRARSKNIQLETAPVAAMSALPETSNTVHQDRVLAERSRINGLVPSPL